VDQNAVVHLIELDIYLDIRFTSWGTTSTFGGSFSYQRAAITPSADFDRNGVVDGQDFLSWQQNFGATGALQTDGDADFDGAVTAQDLNIWHASYGNASPAFRAAPEPGSSALCAAAALAPLLSRTSAARRRRLSAK
jgi:hypothetical protein